MYIKKEEIMDYPKAYVSSNIIFSEEDEKIQTDYIYFIVLLFIRA
jgi:hypothetical protein